MTQLRHSLELGPRDLVSRVLRHLRRVAPVVLASEEVYWAFVRVDGFDSAAVVPAVEVEVEVAVVDAVGLRAVRVPE